MGGIEEKFGNIVDKSKELYSEIKDKVEEIDIKEFMDFISNEASIETERRIKSFEKMLEKENKVENIIKILGDKINNFSNYKNIKNLDEKEIIKQKKDTIDFYGYYLPTTRDIVEKNIDFTDSIIGAPVYETKEMTQVINKVTSIYLEFYEENQNIKTLNFGNQKNILILTKNQFNHLKSKINSNQNIELKVGIINGSKLKIEKFKLNTIRNNKENIDNYAIKESKNIITKFEGYETEAYADSKGVMTIGYGTTRIVDKRTGKLRKVKWGDKITKKEAEKYLNEEIQRIHNFLDRNKFYRNEKEKIGLTSFFYNLGTSENGKKTLFHLLENAKFDEAIAFTQNFKYIKKKNKNTGKYEAVELKGLARRREYEYKYMIGKDTIT